MLKFDGMPVQLEHTPQYYAMMDNDLIIVQLPTPWRGELEKQGISIPQFNPATAAGNGESLCTFQGQLFSPFSTLMYVIMTSLCRFGSGER